MALIPAVCVTEALAGADRSMIRRRFAFMLNHGLSLPFSDSPSRVIELGGKNGEKEKDRAAKLAIFVSKMKIPC